MIGAPNVVLELTAIDAEQFVAYRKHQQLFQTLLEAGVFNTQNGSVIMEFNREGDLMEIKKHTLVFKRRASMV